MDARGEGYVVPTYTAPEDTTWYHFLHGNVPGHQIDFMYRPEVPQGALTRQHFSHLSRLMKYIEPHTNSPYAFAIGNLSRDDTQYEPGHGGIALIFGLRVRGVTDHAGRQDPPFAHAIAAVDRELDYRAVLDSAMSFYRHMFSREYDNPCTVMYREYVKYAGRNPEVLPTVLKAYTADFEELPAPEPSSLSLQWRTNEAPQPKRIVIVHPNNAPFGDLAECAARIAAVLYRSDIRWTAISNGRESDLPNGVSIRFVAKSDAAQYESGGPVMRLEEVPDTEAEIAEKLFGATPVVLESAAKRAPGWRELYKGGGTSVPPPGASAAGSGAPYEVEAQRGPESGRHRYGERPAAEGAASAGSYEASGPQSPGPHAAGGRSRPWENKADSTATQALGDEFIEIVNESAAPAGGLGAGSARLNAGARAGVEAPPQPPPARALAGAALVGSSVGAATTAGLEPTRPPEEPHRSRALLWVGLGVACAAIIVFAAIAITHTEEGGGESGANTLATEGASSSTTGGAATTGATAAPSGVAAGGAQAAGNPTTAPTAGTGAGSGGATVNPSATTTIAQTPPSPGTRQPTGGWKPPPVKNDQKPPKVEEEEDEPSIFQGSLPPPKPKK